MANAEKVHKAVEWYTARRPSYEALARRVESILREVLEAKSLNYHSISSRAKEVPSYKRKASEAKYIEPQQEIMDMAGVRVITYTQSDAGTVADIVKGLFDIMTEHSINKTEELGVDRVGYRAVHFVGTLGEARRNLPENQMFDDICFEIQVRTILEDVWAEFEHDRIYKSQGNLPLDIRRRVSILAGGLELFDREFDSIAREIKSYTATSERKTESSELAVIDSTSPAAPKHLQETVSFVEDEIEGPHLMQDDCEQLILGHLQFLKNLLILERKQRPNKESTSLTSEQIVEYVGQAERRWFSKNDLDKLGSGETRWKRTARFAFSNLKRESLIEGVRENQYLVTDKGTDLVQQWWAEFPPGLEIPPESDQPLGIFPREIQKAVGVRRPHLFQSDFEREILRAFQREPRAIVNSERIVEWIGASLQVWFRSGDFVKLESGETRWERTARWAISNLERKGHIEAVQANQYRVTERGLSFIDEVNCSGMFIGLGMIPAWKGRPIRLDPNRAAFR